MENCTAVSDIFSGDYVHLRKSWQWIRKGFEAELKQLRDEGKLTENGDAKVIWNTKSKFTIVCTSPSGRRVVYKQYRKSNRKFHYTHRISPLAREATNYGMLEKLGFPMAKLLAAGDIRKNFILKGGYLMTEFADGCRNGIVFCPGEELANDRELCMKFCRAHIPLLAKLHDNGIFHRGFAPGNLLWRQKGDEVEPVWIDVATCREKNSFLLKLMLPEDLGNLFGRMALSKEEMEELLALYMASVKVKRYKDLDTLRKKVRSIYKSRMDRFYPGEPHVL